MIQMNFSEFMAPIDPVHDLKRIAGLQFATAIFDPAHERRRFGPIAKAHERIKGEGGVPNPSVPIVPVARAANFFGQAEGWRRYDRAVRCRSQQFQDHRRAIYDLAPTTVIM